MIARNIFGKIEPRIEEYFVRKYYGFPNYLNTDLSEKEDCFCFNTEHEANKCLRDVFENGEWMED